MQQREEHRRQYHPALRWDAPRWLLPLLLARPHRILLMHADQCIKQAVQEAALIEAGNAVLRHQRALHLCQPLHRLVGAGGPGVLLPVQLIKPVLSLLRRDCC